MWYSIRICLMGNIVNNKFKIYRDVLLCNDSLSLAIKYYDCPSDKKFFYSKIFNTLNLLNIKYIFCQQYIVLDELLEYKKYPKTLLLLLRAVRDKNVRCTYLNSDGRSQTSIKNAHKIYIYNDDVYTEIVKDGGRYIVDEAFSSRVDPLRYKVIPRHLQFFVNKIYEYDMSEKFLTDRTQYDDLLEKVERIFET